MTGKPVGESEPLLRHPLTAARQDPDRLFFLTELSPEQADPSPYFASRLTEHLYDEGCSIGRSATPFVAIFHS
jgi:hypothetical protein